jgi:hypothetical protein
MDYQPRAKQAAILEVALAHVNSVKYRVTCRWLFYRLFQEGIYRGKNDYKNKFLPLVTKARKAAYNGWQPWTLADDTRAAVIRGNGFTDGREWVEGIQEMSCHLDKWANQPNYVEIMFEAAAMFTQFEYYTNHVTLVPFKGDPSVDYKWQIAQRLMDVGEKYPDKQQVILYFGDLDTKGMQIPLSAMADIRQWTYTEPIFIRCGLNPGDEVTYNLPEQFDRPGAYQWEALDDDDARDLITESLSQYINTALFDAVEVEEQAITEKFRLVMDDVLNNWA